MDKNLLQTAAIIATIVVAMWYISGEIKFISGGVKANTIAIADLRDDMRELRSLLVLHIAGHSHSSQG